jgi:triosephosphate isomerase
LFFFLFCVFRLCFFILKHSQAQIDMRSFVGGNHKMVGTKSSLAELIGKLKAGLGDVTNVDVVIAPPSVYLDFAHSLVVGSPLLIGGQNCHEKPSGAFTGETSVEMLRDVGCSWVIIGHSERRHVFGEQDAQLALKVFCLFSFFFFLNMT